MSESVVEKLDRIAEASIKQSHEANACGDHVESQRLAIQATQVGAAAEVLKVMHRLEALLVPISALAESFRGEPE